MTFKTVEFPLSSAVAVSGTVTLPYPSGSVQADFDPAGAHLATIAGAALTSAGSDFSLTFNANDVTFTNGASAFILPAGRVLRVQMEEFTVDLTGADVGFTNVDAGVSGQAGTVDIFPATALKGRVRLSAADSAGDTVTEIKNASQAAARTYTIPDAGAAAADFVMDEGAQTLGGVKTFSSIPIFPTGGLTVGTTTLTEAELAILDTPEGQTADPSAKVTLFDDFLTATLDNAIWPDGEGSDAQSVGPVVVAAVLEGAIAAVSGNANSATTTVDTAGTSGADLNWTTANGGLAMETRIQVDDITNCSFFAGFTDRVVSDGGTEMPIDASGTNNDLDASGAATDAAGIIFDTEFVTDPTLIHLGATSGGTPGAIVVGTLSPSNDTYVTLRVTINAARTLEGFVDGTSIGTIATALADVALTPIVVVRSRTTALRTIQIDYIWAQQDR